MAMRRLFVVLVLALLLCGYAVGAEKDDLKSGPQVGDNLPEPFHSLVVHSEEPRWVGKKMDFFGAYEADPVVLIFAREMTKPLTKLGKKLDAEIGKRKPGKLRAIVVMLSDDDTLEKTLKDYGEKQELKHVHLAIMEPDGPRRYNLSKGAEVTVVMYKNLKVEANHAFTKGELSNKAVERILADVPKILPE